MSGMKVPVGGGTVRLRDIPEIRLLDVEQDDRQVKTFDGTDFSWTMVVLRQRTDELYKLVCYDGPSGYDEPGLPVVDLPKGLRITNH